MRQKYYIVKVVGSVWVDTTVAVIAKSEDHAAKVALDGVDCDTEAWRRDPNLYDDPTVIDVSEETWDELQYADQKHLLGPRRAVSGPTD